MQPLDYLNDLLEQGYDYSEAEWRTSQKFNVSCDDLRDDYDRQAGK